jgi:hypothetical protein
MPMEIPSVVSPFSVEEKLPSSYRVSCEGVASALAEACEDCMLQLLYPCLSRKWQAFIGIAGPPLGTTSQKKEVNDNRQRRHSGTDFARWRCRGWN